MCSRGLPIGAGTRATRRAGMALPSRAGASPTLETVLDHERDVRLPPHRRLRPSRTADSTPRVDTTVNDPVPALPASEFTVVGATRPELLARRLLRSVVSNSAGRFVGLLSWFLLTPFLLSRLGPTNYGLWVIIQSVIGVSSLLDLGIGGAVTRYVAQHVARAEFDAAHRLVATALRLYALIGLGIFLASVIAAPVAAGLLASSDGEARDVASLAILIGLSAGFSIPLSIARSVLYGLQRYDIANLVDTVGTLASAAATISVLLLGAGVAGMLATNVPVYMLVFVASQWFIRRIAPQLRFGWFGADRSLVGPVLGFSWPLLTMRVATQLQTRMDEIVIAAFLPLSAVTPYAREKAQ